MNYSREKYFAAFLVVSSTLAVVDAAESPRNSVQRFMPFLARNAVVQESSDKAILVGPQDSFEIITAGSPNDTAGVNKDVERAAFVLTDYLRKITTIAASQNARHKIYLHTAASATHRFPELEKADAHGFVLKTDEANLHIASSSQIGTLYGAWFFLQNYSGVRILMQGDLGEVIPQQPAVSIPRQLYVFNPGPDFQLRIHSGLQQLDPTAWLQDRNDSQRYQYHHNLFEIYSPEKFGLSRPEYFPTIGGKRYIPNAAMKSGWQPILSSDASVQRAIDYADELFSKQPQLKTISLTPNDGAGWAEEDLRIAAAKGIPIRDVFYDYMNRVARGVREKWPDRFVSALSYLEYQEPPSFPLEDNCMIFIWTKDGNVQPEFEKWKNKAKHFGSYQWIYGSGYPFPNHWPHTIQDFLRLIQSRGAKAFKSEFYDFHGHGCVRLWVVSNLLWNVDADVDAILQDYFRHAYGNEAAPAMARYFAEWEQVHQRRLRPNAFNLVDRKGAERKFETITDQTISNCEQALSDARRAVVGEQNRQRIEMVAAMFQRARHYYEHCLYLKKLRAGPVDPTNLAEGREQLRNAAGAISAEHNVYETNFKLIEKQALYCAVPLRDAWANHLPWRVNYLQMDPRILLVTADSRWLQEDQRIARICRTITSLHRTKDSADAASKFWDQIAIEFPALLPYSKTEQLSLQSSPPKLENLIRDGSFETTLSDDFRATPTELLQDMRSFKVNWVDSDHCEVPFAINNNWNALQKRVAQTVRITSDRSERKDGTASLKVEAIGQMGGLITKLSLPDTRARYRLSFWHKAPHGAKLFCGMMQYRIRPMPYFEQFHDAAKDWTKITIEFPFNHQLAADESSDVSLWLGVWAGNAQSPVWFDDVRLERIAIDSIRTQP